MRISIWQQFASNHSNSFIVVGRFQTVEQAQQAYQSIRSVLQHLREGYLAVSYPLTKLPGDDYSYYPTPIDVDAFRSYNILPRKMIDWVSYDYRGDFLEETLQIYDRHIYVSAFGYAGYEP